MAFHQDDTIYHLLAGGLHLATGGGKASGRVAGPELLDVRGNFCNLYDTEPLPRTRAAIRTLVAPRGASGLQNLSKFTSGHTPMTSSAPRGGPTGSIIYTPAMPGAPDDVFARWTRTLAQAGTTHLYFGPGGGAAYPGMTWANPDGWADMGRFRAFVERCLDTPSADGKGFRPVLFMGGDTFDQSQIHLWPDMARALQGLHQYFIVVPGWECIPQQGWTSAQYSEAMEALHRYFPESPLFVHFQPTRWNGASNPPEDDDPWQGAEGGFYTSHGGQYVQGVFYQTQHAPVLYRACECPNRHEKYGHSQEDDVCWRNRAEDGIGRAGAGDKGWRPIRVVLGELTAYEAYRHQATPNQARDLATLFQEDCRKWGVQAGYGNGLPW